LSPNNEANTLSTLDPKLLGDQDYATTTDPNAIPTS
jgi:hypothetical protein